MESTLYTVVSIGLAAENKALSTDRLEVVPIEQAGYLDGEIATSISTLECSGVDSQGNAYTSNVNVTMTLTCEWMKEGSNRTTSPDIRRSEKVQIKRYADTDKYYWVALGDDDDKRKLETVVHSFSGTTDENEKEITPENSYQVEVSTHKKLARLSTSKKNGEVIKLDVIFDPGKGNWGVMDDLGNFMLVDSLEDSFLYQNRKGSFIEVVGDDVNINAVKNINLAAGENITLKAGKNIEITAGKEVKVNTVNYIANISAAYTVKAATLSYSFTSGNFSSGGSVNMGGTYNFNDTITHQNKSIGIDHKHTEQGDGKPTSGVN